MDQVEITASPKLRIFFIVMAVAILALWGLSLIPPAKTLGDPNEDGFSYVPAIWATMTCLPVGLFLLRGAVAGRGRHVARARTALLLRSALLFLVMAFLVFQHFADSIDGS